MIERYGEYIHFHALQQTIAYSAIRVIDDHGQTQLTPGFIKMVEKHPAYPVVLANTDLVKDWKKQLDDTAKTILESPVGKYIK